jgi:hypothetical protein
MHQEAGALEHKPITEFSTMETRSSARRQGEGKSRARQHIEDGSGVKQQAESILGQLRRSR